MRRTKESIKFCTVTFPSQELRASSLFSRALSKSLYLPSAKWPGNSLQAGGNDTLNMGILVSRLSSPRRSPNSYTVACYSSGLFKLASWNSPLESPWRGEVFIQEYPFMWLPGLSSPNHPPFFGRRYKWNGVVLPLQLQRHLNSLIKINVFPPHILK